ncbi:MAG TPA: hypothetical protein DD434_09975, partial [Bacteroidales bacterium]|nr:hypothetical protein [Bacteroidales bacterium]
ITNEDIEKMSANTVDAIIADVGKINLSEDLPTIREVEKPKYEIITENASSGIATNNNLLTQEYIVKMKYSIKSGEKSKIIPLE